MATKKIKKVPPTLTYRKGKLHGSYKTYYENGKIEADLHYNQDELYGLQIYYSYYDGGSFEKINYKNGVKDGVYEYYDENNNLVEKGTFRDGKMDGTWDVYYANGELKGVLRSRNFYKNDLIDGVSTQYWDADQVYCQSHYENGLKHGPYKKYDLNGQIIDKGVYKNGKKVK